MSLIVTLSGPESTRAKAEVALEDAHLPIFPPNHYAIHRESYRAEHWPHLTALSSGKDPKQEHGFVCVLAADAVELNTAVTAVSKAKWVLRTHRELPDEPKADPMRALLQKMQAEIEALKAKAGLV